MSENGTVAASVIIATVDQAGNHQEVFEAVSNALGGARLVHSVGGPTGASVDSVVENPDRALSEIILAVEEDREANAGSAILAGSGNLDFDFRIAAVTGAGVVLVAVGDDDAAIARVRVAISSARARFATPLAVILTGAGDATPDLGVPVVKLGEHAALREALTTDVPVAITPQRFEWSLLGKAKQAQRHIVLPEGDDDRILIAANELLAQDICELTILGDPEAMSARAKELGLDLSKASLWDPEKSEYLDSFAEEFAEMRKSKGMTLEEAKETMHDISYFATMMIHKGLADGMVSGAAHTTAHTIKPSFQIIKTRPGASTVSSLFLMVMDGHLWGFADCAVLPKPAPDQLGEIAVVSAQTAAAFGIEPKVAMLSYSTGTSGSGEDVDRVIAGLAKARELNPDLAVDGPLQFDAAVSPTVAKKKMPDSPVAGQATVFVFPDLDAGNIGYKIAQRCGGALAIGPILQGLNKPVNDLSRGASVTDIINTVAITAIQAGGN